MPVSPIEPSAESSGAGMTPLPPSPDIKPSASQISELDAVPFTLGSLAQPQQPSVRGEEGAKSRLRSVAKYQTFSPQALACSDPIPATTASSNMKYGSSTAGTDGQQPDGRLINNNNQSRRPQSGQQQASSLGAVAGSQGVVVFRISRPHEPLMMLNQATPNRQHAAGGRPVTALAFQPDATSSLYLAAARGSGVLLWDVSGHSLSPLIGRLAMDSSMAATPEAECVTTSLCWKLSQERDGIPLLATTTSNSACIWDLRCPVASAKPSVRFGGSSTSVTRKSANNPGSPYRQIACSRSHECAILDTAGMVRVFDVRMTEKSRFGANPLTSFTAFGHAGVGISYLPLTASGTGTADKNYSTTAWVTWGLDSPNNDAVVKVWSSYSSKSDDSLAPDDTHKRTGSATIPENYWFMDGSPGRSSGSVAPYRLIAQCSPPYHLACPRVCPAPVENGILTIGLHHDTGRGGGEGWRAELWKVRPPASYEIEANDGTFGMEKIIGFDGGADRDKGIVSAIGKEGKIGKLKAAELAITPYNLLVVGRKATNHDDELVQEGDGVGLALCCLSDNGFVTTHMIPEALPKKLSNQLDGTGSVSPQRSAVFPNGRPKVFADERETVDAARLWGGQGERSNRPAAASEARSAVELMRNAQTSPVMEGGLLGGPQQPSSRHNDGAMAPLFEMDVPAVAYGNVATGGISGVQIGPIDLTSPKVPATSALVEEKDNTTADVRDVAAMTERMNNIETERIPCPRLCGATFGPGIGGLAMFKNGDVKKMWMWYDRAGSSSRLAGIPSAIIAPEQAFSGPGNSTKGGSIEAHETVDMKISMPRDSPRTMKDLMDMVSAAKEAQWGEVNNEGDADSNDQEEGSNDNFFEYMSTGSISSESDNEPADFGSEEISTGKGSRSIYENYFGKFRRPVAQPSAGGNSKKTEGEGQPSESSRTGSPVSAAKVQVVGPSSDTLAPSVHVTHDFDKIALNNQSAELAKEWELGQWQGDITGTCPSCDIEKLRPRAHHYSELNLLHAEGFRGESVKQTQESQRGLPSYRGLAPSPPKPGQVTRPKSDPMLAAMAPGKKVHIENEPGVHGGEYAVRPNVQESMVFLRKLFSHQQHEGNQHFPPTLLSPPDSPMINTRPKSAQNPESLKRQSMSAEGSSRSKVLPGVYALSSDTQGQILHDDYNKFRHIRSTCIHNAEVCERLDETGKQGVWKLLAQMVDRQLNEPADAFNGWGGKGGGALGVDLVASFMRYYEALGDCQMLATMVCVLKEGNNSFLPEGQDEKYDTYIRCYSDLLFGWGLLEKRAELNKHLVQRVQESEGKLLNGAGDERLPGIALAFACPKCGKEAEFGTNICRSCQEFAFKCSICENGVRGLYTVCDACGHGGHVGHMTSWFSKHAQCPAGCGCFCTFTSNPQRRSVTEVSAPPRGETVGLGSFLPLDPLDDRL